MTKDGATVKKLEAETKLLEAEHTRTLLEIEELERKKAETLSTPAYAGTYTFYSRVDSETVKTAMRDLGAWARRDEEKRGFKIIFNSPGGSVIDGLAFYDFLRELSTSGHKIETVALGMAASMGGVLLQAGDKRVIGNNAYMLIHEVSSIGLGKVSEMEDELKFTKRLQERLLSILAERSTMAISQIKTKWKKTDWWLDSEEVIRLGFADEIR